MRRKCRYILLCKTAGVMACIDGVLFGGQAKAVKADGVKHVVALHALHARNDIGCCITFGVTDMQSRAGGVGEHVEYIVFGSGKIVQVGVESSVAFPILGPFLFNFIKIGVSHRANSLF